MKKILNPYSKNGLILKNHVVMAPMTRSRAIGNLPNGLMANYYGQRSGAGLIITEGTAPSPQALGYPRIPGIYSREQVEAWKEITNAVHAHQSKIFLQIMHTGRIAHRDNLPKGVDVVGPSDRKAEGQIFTDDHGLQNHSQPVPLTKQGIKAVINDFVSAARNAISAGFDGIELHAANGYLLEQFLNPNVNTREDEYGGNLIKRTRLTLEIARKTAQAIGQKRVGIRFSPYSTLGDLQPYDLEEVHETYAYLARELAKIDITYIHISANPSIPKKTYDSLRSEFSRTIILSNGLTPETGEDALQNGLADLVAFGRSFLANPDFVQRIKLGAELNQPDYNTLYTPGEEGYTDYPLLSFAQSIV